MLRPSPRPCPSSHQRTQPISLLTGQDLPTTSHEACGGGGTVQKELTLEEFHASDPQRAAAPEVPYGSLWREFAPVPAYRLRSEEHTSELQSRQYLVCRLLLEKKKKNIIPFQQQQKKKKHKI